MKIAISVFKAKSLKLLDEIHNSGEIIIVTKRGVPFAKVLPINNTVVPTDLKGTLVFQDDEIYSTKVDWFANNDNS